MVVRNHLAILRNLRNIESVGVSERHWDKLRRAFGDPSWENQKILPFQFVSAWRYAPAFARQVESAMLRAVKTVEKLGGKTVLVVDVSGSMEGVLSSKSDMTRLDAAGALAVALAELTDDLRVFTFSAGAVEVPAARGFGIIDGINKSQEHGGTYIGKALAEISKKIKGYDRLIVITDEQAHDEITVVPDAKRLYLVNVAPYQNGVDTQGKWTRINGFSTAIVDWIREEEKNPLWKGEEND